MKQTASTILLVIALLFVAGSAQARAQDVPTFNPEQVPVEGRRPEDFVPRRWKIGAREEGDLNGDRFPDHALQLVPEDYDSSGISLLPNVPQYILSMFIRSGVLVIDQNYGMSDVADIAHLLRYEPSAGRFLLIGKDKSSYHRPEGPRWPATKVSENYLVGVRLTTTDRRLSNGTNRHTTRRGRVARVRVFLEDVDVASDH